MVEAFVLIFMWTTTSFSPPMDGPSCDRMRALLVSQWKGYYDHFDASRVKCVPVKVPK
jgi:hypothetical protein